MAFRTDLTGKVFSRWTVIKYIGANQHRESIYLCHCICGTEKKILGYALNNGNTTSCGCYRKEILSKWLITHGETVNGKASNEYNIWSGMKKRCYKKWNKAYKYYGGRGIKICKRWLYSFENFLKDMGRKPGPGYSIDRINNNGNYKPSNCRWATAYQQVHNRRVSFHT